MKDVERVLGKLEEFRESTKVRLDRIEHKVESIQNLRWKIMGGASVVSFFLTMLINYFIGKVG